jgi:hypothetical protein
MRYLRTNTATRITVGPFLDKTDGITPEVALTVTSEKLTFVVDTAGVPTLILDIAPTASGGANDMVHITNDDSGYYDLELAAADVNYLGRAMLSLNDVATHLPVFHEFMILPANIYDSMILGTDLFDVSMTQILGTAVSTPATAGILDVNLKNIANATVSTSTAQLGVNTVNIGGTAQTGRDMGASVLISPGTGTGQLSVASGVIAANVTQIDGSANGTHATGMIPADARDILGTAISSPATAGVLDINVKNIANAVVNTATAQIGANVVSQANIDFGALQKTSLNAATPASVQGNVGGNVTGSVGSLATQAKADVNAEVVDVLSTDTSTELSAVPTTTGTLRQMIQFIFQYFRNKKTVSATTETLFKEDASTTLGTSTVSDNGTTFTKGEMN